VASRVRTQPLSWNRIAGALLGVLGLVCAVAALVYALSVTTSPWPWAALSASVLAAGIGAHLARRR